MAIEKISEIIPASMYESLESAFLLHGRNGKNATVLLPLAAAMALSSNPSIANGAGNSVIVLVPSAESVSGKATGNPEHTGDNLENRVVISRIMQIAHESGLPRGEGLYEFKLYQ